MKEPCSPEALLTGCIFYAFLVPQAGIWENREGRAQSCQYQSKAPVISKGTSPDATSHARERATALISTLISNAVRLAGVRAQLACRSLPGLVPCLLKLLLTEA